MNNWKKISISKLAKVAKKGLGRVLVDSLKVGAKKWAGGIAEEGLSSITSGVGRFTVRVIERMVTSIKRRKNSSQITCSDFVPNRFMLHLSFSVWALVFGLYTTYRMLIFHSAI